MLIFMLKLYTSTRKESTKTIVMLTQLKSKYERDKSIFYAHVLLILVIGEILLNLGDF